MIETESEIKSAIFQSRICERSCKAKITVIESPSKEKSRRLRETAKEAASLAARASL
jgi:hypothetical protein